MHKKNLHYLLRTSAFFLCLFIFFPVSSEGQSSAGGFKSRGDYYYDLADYRAALNSYRQGGLENSKDKKVRLKIGVCLYEINDVDASIRMFQTLINEGKTDAAVFLHMAKSYQAKKLFTEAISFYKKFLQKSKPNDALRSWAKDEIIRCANGNRLKYADEQAYVENAGTTINTQFGEFGVRTSPTTIDKIYFNSDRDDVSIGKRPNGNFDIYGTTLFNGRWTTPSPLPAHINSAGYDEVCGFSTDGQILYYVTSVGNQFAIRTDTFTTTDVKKIKGIFQGPYLPGQGGADLIFFNDSICLFSSTMAGGYGGYDLYISLLKNGIWTDPANLGPVINSFYDDRFPYLTRDGLTIFYSSNSLESMGGFDIFSSSFNADSYSWSQPVNAGLPINSPLDDTYMILSPDGMTAYLNSNRKEGYGKEDIYSVFFKQPIEAHQHISEIPTFYQQLLLRGNDASPNIRPSEKIVEIKEFFVSHLYLDENAEVLTPQNMKKLDLLANLLLIYPKIMAELSCFELPSGQSSFSLYFSIKKAEKAAEYLVKKGIQRQRILLKGYGSSFPLVAKAATSAPSPLYQKLNQRLEITLHHFENEPVIVHVENIQVPQNIQDARGSKFYLLRDQLYYSVQIASITQMLQNPEVESLEEMFIDANNPQGNYLYMVGMIPTYKEADQLQSTMMDLGFPDAQVIPYINGFRISRTQVPDLTEQYPDLLFYLNGTRK